MLINVHIENVALIKSLDIPFPQGFSAFTGETGAGKSIVIDAIGMACGARIGKEILRTGEKEARVEALFCDLSERAKKRLGESEIYPDEDGNVFVVRTLNEDGKSTVSVNGKRIPLTLLRAAASALVNIHGQHDNADLLDDEKHSSILDAFAGNVSQRSLYAERYEKYRAVEKALQGAALDDKEKKRRIDILKFQIGEIKDAKLKDGEEEKLQAERNRLRHSEKINKNASVCYSLLYESASGLSAVDSVERAGSAMRALSDVIPEAAALSERLESVKYELIDIAETANDFVDDVGDPTAALDRIEARLEKISRLCSRYGADIKEVNAFCAACEKELSDIELSEERKGELEKELTAAKEELSAAAKELYESRLKAAKALSKKIEEELSYLDMRSARFDVRFTPYGTFSPNGAEKAEFLIRTNSGEGFHSLSKTASGGELSRVMLALKSVLSDKEGADTLIFDEIDTGISGSTSRKIGRKLRALAVGKQVFCVTHSAQVASLSDCHFKIEKHAEGDRTVTTVQRLSDEEKVREIARIISGMDITDAALRSAKELIERTDE